MATMSSCAASRAPGEKEFLTQQIRSGETGLNRPGVTRTRYTSALYDVLRLREQLFAILLSGEAKLRPGQLPGAEQHMT